jgi:hypothetical protein
LKSNSKINYLDPRYVVAVAVLTSVTYKLSESLLLGVKLTKFLSKRSFPRPF